MLCTIRIRERTGQQSEFEIPDGTYPAGAGISARRRQQAGDSAQSVPGGLIERWISANEIANHLPGGDVEGAFRGRTHRERNRALRAETNPLRGRFLARTDTYRLRKHIDCDRLMAGFQFTIAANAVKGFQAVSASQSQILGELLQSGKCAPRFPGS